MNHDKIFNTVTSNGMREMTLERFREAIGMLWTSPCTCPPDEKTGETWCCNHCGRPTARTSEELPGDDRMIIEILNRIVIHSKNLRSYEGGHGVVVALANECLVLLNDKHDLLASKDARIRELEEELEREKNSVRIITKDAVDKLINQKTNP